MATGRLTPYETELGKAVCDRLGLAHGSTLQDWSAERVGKAVMVTMTTVKAIPADEYSEIQSAAERRATEVDW